MHQTVPEFIVENYRAGRRRGNFQAATLFIDLSGFSRITDALMPHGQPGAEELTRQMHSVFDPLMKGVVEHGGQVVGLAGDGVTAVYPAEPDLRSAACEALASARLIQERLAAIAVMRTPYGEFPISAKIGLACGEVSWGILESANQKRATFYFRGEAVDDSAEAEHHAEAREIVLSETAGELLQGVAECEPRFGFRVVAGVRGDLPDSREVTIPPGDPEVTRIFAPAALSTGDARSEFRHAVHLFLRIPDLSDDALHDFMVTLFELQEHYGGLLSHLDFGDKGCSMLLLWGAPVTFENDISRALNFALELQSRATFPITAGITFYLALAGYVGSALFEDYTCYGWGVNLAARYMMAAPDGAILLDERMVQRIIRSFSMEYVGEQAFKGFAQKQRVYVLKGRKAEVESFYEGRLAGRDAEIHKLAERIEPLWQARYAGVALIAGEAGIGKSRLVHEFKASSLFADRNVLWAVCQTDQVLRLSFNPFRYWLARYFDVVSAPDDAARLRSFELRFDELRSAVQDVALLEDVDQARSFLAALVDVRWPDSPYERMDAQGRYDNTLIAVITLMKAESRRQPLILFIEDAHFLDEDSKVLLVRLKRVFSADTSAAVAILVTSRPEEGRLLVEEGFADTRIDLGGLSADAMTALSDDILGQPATPDLIRFIDQRADGNPFFAEQILRYLQAEGLLELNDSGRWMLSRGWQSSALPADVMTMLVARLDQLAREVQDVIQTASVLGREFEVQVLSRMLNDEATVDYRVSEAERASVWSPLNELRYLFRHALLRDAAYTMQLQAQRRRLHAMAVEALEGLYPKELAFHYPELAFHSEQADLVEKARF
ncbi:MAG TPA: AAA family ATPase, partial [Anaerolineales bacterium]